MEALGSEEGIEVKSTGAESNATGSETENTEEQMLRERLEAYGTAVRAGAITPSIGDEEAFRKELGLPPLDGNVKKVWEDEKYTRRPITLKGGKEEQQVVEEVMPQNESEEEDESV
jgi:hypothetical protein